MKKLLLCGVLCAAAVAFTGCEKEKSDVKQAAETVAAKSEEVAKATADAAEKAGQAVKAAAEDVAKKVDAAAK